MQPLIAHKKSGAVFLINKKCYPLNIDANSIFY